MSVLLGIRTDGEVGLFVAPDGVNARTCTKGQLIYEVGNQAQAFKNDSYTFTSADVYQTKYYRKVITFADQGIKPIVFAQPNRNTHSAALVSGEFRADNITTYLDAAYVNSSQNPAAVQAAQDLGCVFKFKVTNTSLEVICSKNTNIGFSYMILNRAYNEPTYTAAQKSKIRIDNVNNRLLISRPGEAIDVSQPQKCWLNSDLANLRKWGVAVNVFDPAYYNVLELKPNSGVTMHQKILAMFRPQTGKVYNIGTSSFTSSGFLMAYTSALYVYSLVGGFIFDIGNGGQRFTGVGIEEYKANDQINIRSFEDGPIEIGLFVFHNNMG